MLSRIKKDKKRRYLVKKFEIKTKQAKVLFQDLSLKKAIEKSCCNRKIKPFISSFVSKNNFTMIPKNSSLCRVKNRCVESGRSKAVMQFCKLSRIVLRNKASRGEIPGVTKASW